MRVYRRRRVYTLVVFLAFAGLIFLAFQMLSIKVLNIESQSDRKCEGGLDCKKRQHKEEHYNQHDVHKIGEKLQDFNKNVQMPTKDDNIVQDSPNLKLKEKEDELKFHPRQLKPQTAEPAKPLVEVSHTEETVEERNRPRGVPRHWTRLYKADAQSMFTCTDSREKIPFKHMNDDYCDCKDGSDEPGTSACINGRFYCHVQLFADNLKWIPSSQVNDGICDCCDSSDEWENNILPNHVKLSDERAGYGVYQAPCVNRCGVLLEEVEAFNHIKHSALLIKARYIQQAKGKLNPNQLYGKDGEYFALSQACFQHHADKYKYTVCPFKEVRQETSLGSPKIIGRSPAEWVLHGNYGNQLKMDRGDSIQCPGNQSRMSWLTFTCGLKDDVLSVHETEVCEYTIKFSTPAAC